MYYSKEIFWKEAAEILESPSFIVEEFSDHYIKLSRNGRTIEIWENPVKDILDIKGIEPQKIGHLVKPSILRCIFENDAAFWAQRKTWKNFKLLQKRLENEKSKTAGNTEGNSPK